MNKKYELVKTDTLQTPCGKTLFRVRALIAIGLSVSAGGLGGYIESEQNLHAYGNAWVSGNARVYGNARVCDNAQVYGDARVCGNALVYDDAQVCDNACVYGNALVYDDAHVRDNACVYGNALVYGDARVCGNALVSCNSSIVWFTKVGSENGTLTVCRGENGLVVTRGCFCGSVDEFFEASNKKHDEKIRREYELLIEVAKSRIGVDQ